MKRVVCADSRYLLFPTRCSRLPGSDDDLPGGRVHSDVFALKVYVLLLPQLHGIWSILANLTRGTFLALDEDLQDHVEDRFAPAHLYNNDIIDMQITTIVLCVAVACLYGADFFL